MPARNRHSMCALEIHIAAVCSEIHVFVGAVCLLEIHVFIGPYCSDAYFWTNCVLCGCAVCLPEIHVFIGTLLYPDAYFWNNRVLCGCKCCVPAKYRIITSLLSFLPDTKEGRRTCCWLRQSFFCLFDHLSGRHPHTG